VNKETELPKQRDLSKIERVLIFRTGSLGDTVIALPIFHLIAKAFPNAERRLLNNVPRVGKAAPAASILDESGLVHDFMHFTVTPTQRRSWLALRTEIRRWNPQALVYLVQFRGLFTVLRDWLFFRACGIPVILCLPLRKDMQKLRWLPGENRFEQMSVYLARYAAELGDAHLDDLGSWDLRLSQTEHQTALNHMGKLARKPIIAISVGTKMQSKDWGAANWHALLQHIAPSYSDYGLVMIGAKEEHGISEEAASGWRDQLGPDSVVNLCGYLTPRESAAVLSRARLFVGHDSGPMHLAAAMGTTCVAIFSAMSLPAEWFPYGPEHRVLYKKVKCAGCRLETCIVQNKKCLSAITVDEVAREIAALLPHGTPINNLTNAV
jgi:ADP-heptose:LPS heptosyltransferase